MRQPEFTRTTTFRWSLAVASMLAVYVILLFGIIYWGTKSYLTARSDAVVTRQAQVFGAATTQDRLTAIDQLLAQDPRRVQHAGLFTAEGQRIAGNMERVPPGLPIDGPAQSSLVPVGPGGAEQQVVRAVARRLSNGDVLVIGRAVDETTEISEIVGKTLAAGLIPALCLCLAAGVLLRIRAQRRDKKVHV